MYISPQYNQGSFFSVSIQWYTVLALFNTAKKKPVTLTKIYKLNPLNVLYTYTHTHTHTHT